MSAIAVVVALVPLATGYGSSSPRLRFAGWLGQPGDVASYFMWMRQAATGRVLLENLYDATLHAPFFLHPLWNPLGWVAGLLGVELRVAYAAAHVVFAALWVAVAWRLADRVATAPAGRWTAWALLVFGSGLGWLWAALGLPQGLLVAPPDLTTAEATAFHSMLVMPHFTMALVLLGLATLGIDDALAGRAAGAPKAGAWLALLGWAHPYESVPVVAALVGLVGAAAMGEATTRRERLRARWDRLAPAFAGALLPVAAYALLARFVPQMAAWNEGNWMPAPPVWAVLAGTGIPGALAVAAVWRARRRQAPGLVTWALWLALCAVVLTQTHLVAWPRRFLHAVWLPVAVAGGWAAARLVERARWPRWIAAGLVLAALPGSVLSLTQEVRAVLARDTVAWWPPTWREICVRLSRMEHPRKIVVLAPVPLGVVPPACAGTRSWVGHPQLTPDYARRGFETRRFFAGEMKDHEAVRWLAHTRADYVWAPRPMELSGALSTRLHPVLTNADGALYRVAVGRGDREPRGGHR